MYKVTTCEVIYKERKGLNNMPSEARLKIFLKVKIFYAERSEAKKIEKIALFGSEPAKLGPKIWGVRGGGPPGVPPRSATEVQHLKFLSIPLILYSFDSSRFPCNI